MIKNLEEFRKKVHYLSTYRGCKESEIIFINFSKKYLNILTEKQLIDYYNLLQHNDALLLDWLIHKKPAPDDITSSSVYSLILNSIQ